MALINFLKIYNNNKKIIINNKYKNLRLLKVLELPDKILPADVGDNWKRAVCYLDFNMNYIPAIFCSNPEYYITACTEKGRMRLMISASKTVSLKPSDVKKYITVYIFTEEQSYDTTGAGLFIWDPDTKELVFNSKSLYMRVVGSYLKTELLQEEEALKVTMPETKFPCKKAAAVMFSMHESVMWTPQVATRSSLKLNWRASNIIKSEWLVDSVLFTPPTDFPSGVMRSTCILFIDVTGY